MGEGRNFLNMAVLVTLSGHVIAHDVIWVHDCARLFLGTCFSYGLSIYMILHDVSGVYVGFWFYLGTRLYMTWIYLCTWLLLILSMLQDSSWHCLGAWSSMTFSTYIIVHDFFSPERWLLMTLSDYTIANDVIGVLQMIGTWRYLGTVLCSLNINVQNV